MPGITPIFRMGFLKSGETLTGNLERSRWLTVDRQLEALYAFLGNGVISGWELSETVGVSLSITISPGSGVVAGIAAKSSDATILNNLVSGTTAGNTINFIYAKILGHTPYTAQVEFVTSNIFYDSESYLKLGRVIVDKNKKIVQIDVSETSGRKELTFINFVLSLIKDHLHTGAPGDPSKIDLQEHVKGVLDSSFIGNIPASKITGGIISPERFKLSHNDLDDIGTLKHAELDSLVEKLQNINRLLFGDIMTANLMQLYLSFKHVWPEVDQFTQNFFSLIPGIANNQLLNPNTFIDINATTAEVDYINHRIRGKSLPAREIAQATIRSSSDWRNSDFDPNFIRIVDTGLAYGYGYGYGEGLDFFDVFETSDFNFLEGTGTSIGFPGSTYGYGFPPFESNYSYSYGYGYGFEYGFGFPETLTSTIVTLNSQTQTIELHNKKIIDTPAIGDGNNYQASDLFSILTDNLPSASKTDFIRNIGQTATIINGRRSNNIDQTNDSVNNIPDDLYSFYSFILETTGQGQVTDSDKAATYIVWDNLVDLTINNLIKFVISQTDGTPYDENWVFDHSFQLILEFSTATHRFYYLFKSGDLSDRFFIGDQYIATDGSPISSLGTKYFQNIGEIIDNRARFEISAQIDSIGDISFLGGFKIADNTAINSSVDPSIPIFTTLIQSLTGIILYSDTTFGHDNKQINELGATFIKWPQGRRERLEQPTGYDPSSKMLADIDKIFIGGPFGFNDNSENNDIKDLIISFPDRVDFTSISWISEEPGDSIVYIQINRLEEDSPNNYRTNPIYTNNTSRGASLFVGSDIISSGGSFPDIFNNIRGIRLKVVLLPTTDRRVAPTISSITVNYLSNTISNQIFISTQDQWFNAREVTNLTVSGSGQVSIQDLGQPYGKVRNIIYGTNRSVVETSDNFITVVKRYGGSNLPTTVLQLLNGRSPGLSGFITDLKKMNNGDIVILDRDEGRIIILDQGYILKKIIASENVFLTSADSGAGSVGDTATLVKAIYNRELGDNGILYLVFSHQLNAWPIPSSSNLRTSQIFIKSRGQTLDLSSIPISSDNIIACDRGIISFKLTSEISNFVESSENPIVQIFLSASNAGVTFNAGAIPKSGRTDLPITKIGTKGIFSSYNLIYAPIRGIVAFDIDDEDRLLILKRNKVYSWDTINNIDGVWYARFGIDRFWTSWNSSNVPDPVIDPDIETNLNTINGTETHPSLTDPNFFINNYFGYKGSIQRFEDFLLFTFCGDKIVWVTKKDAVDGTEFRQPTEVTIPDDGTTITSARFDPATTTSDDYTFIYVSLSDLRRGSTNSSGKSKVVKIRDGATPGQEIVWRYGAGIDNQETRVVSCNDVRVLKYTEDAVIIST